MKKTRERLEVNPLFRRVVSVTMDLMPVPDVVEKVIKIIDDPKSSSKDVAKVISLEPILAAKVLKIANSAYYGMSGKVATVERAVTVLGFLTLKGIVISFSLLGRLAKKPTRHFDVKKFWEHSVATGIFAQNLGAVLSPVPSLAFTAGLIHDIGKAILSQYLAKEYEKVFLKMEEEKLPIFVAEDEILGFNHADLGAAIAERWYLPSSIVAGIRYHHSPGEAPEEAKMIAEIVSLSDMVVVIEGFGMGDEKYYSFGEIRLKWENLSLSFPLERLIDSFRSSFEEAKAIFFG
jgi:putative nucleotidyltransferase with HDIG domain